MNAGMDLAGGQVGSPVSRCVGGNAFAPRPRFRSERGEVRGENGGNGRRAQDAFGRAEGCLGRFRGFRGQGEALSKRFKAFSPIVKPGITRGEVPPGANRGPEVRGQRSEVRKNKEVAA
jgi:hypothetical protein